MTSSHNQRVEQPVPDHPLSRLKVTQLGEPAHVVARLATSPLQLVGPPTYLPYIRVLRPLFAIVPSLVILVIALELADGVGFTNGLLKREFP